MHPSSQIFPLWHGCALCMSEWLKKATSITKYQTLRYSTMMTNDKAPRREGPILLIDQSKHPQC